MFNVQSDQTKNRLYITLENLSREDVKPILADLTKNIANLKAGFTCLVDIRNVIWQPGTQGEDYVEIIQGALADSGMSKVVRVVNKENIDVHERMEDSSLSLGYTALPASSIEEAEAILDKA